MYIGYCTLNKYYYYYYSKQRQIICGAMGGFKQPVTHTPRETAVDRHNERREGELPKRYLHKLCPHNPHQPESGVWTSQPSLHSGWLALLSQKRGTSSQILARRHTQHSPALTPVIWMCDLCHKQIQYKPDWRCTIHTLTQLVTITPSTHQNKHTTKGHGFVDGSRGGGEPAG